MRSFFIFFILLLVISCDDGDIIITSFEFDDVNLQLCEGALPNEFVFFKINTSTNEAISYNFIDDTYSEREETEEPILIDLENTNNTLIYRQFNTAITADYYCNNIPDSDIIVTEELISIGGQARIINEIVSEDDNDGVEATLESPNQVDPLADPDEDGVPNYLDDDMNNNAIGNVDNAIEPGYDSDNDQIPDFKDQDDDDDNVITSAELPNGIPDDDSFLDTDGDTIPNYLDEDDDGDGVLTRDEDVNGNGNPRDDDTDIDGIPNYLDDDDDGDEELTIDEDINNNGNPMDDDSDNDDIPNYLDTDSPDDVANTNMDNPDNLPNTVVTIFRTTLVIDNLGFNQMSDQFAQEGFSFGFRDFSTSITTPNNN
ncbi:hypothetical protein [Aquimarina sp. RZ0]|uniref:hypothetical protein n=1 Tax=Aquimarina sp. RZ0 TaxID=2607730 RepID=UPI0011F0B41C|nr:hypothetical protein [Aquimarina sp. RZ0]KAA1245501.1 hypothetical protein F0000_11935 [Aquimarina sp. RZ0]